MLAALVALIHKTEPPGDQVLEGISRLLPTPATGTTAADEKKIRIKLSQVKGHNSAITNLTYR